MSLRPRTTAYDGGRMAPQPSAVRLMVALLVAFVVLALLTLFAGALPLTPQPLPNQGATYRQYVANDRQLLESYGYTMEGKVHIPIERAMELTAERGLPTRDNPSETPNP